MLDLEIIGLQDQSHLFFKRIYWVVDLNKFYTTKIDGNS